MDLCPVCRRVYQQRHEFCSADGAATVAITATRDPLVGLVFDERYELVRRIGAGGNGVVYLARQIDLERVVAFKMMYAERLKEERALRRFAREARALAALDHPGCVRVLDYRAPEDSVPYLVMDLVEGYPLGDVIGPEGLAPRHAVSIAAQIARAVGAAHAAGIVHRDLKPDNVVLDVKNGKLRVRLIDFGLAIVVDDAPGGKRLTRAGRVVGTPEYMAPEQVRGGDTDGRTDLYALGVLLHEMLEGEPPFQGATPAATAALQLEAAPRPVALPGLPPALAERLRAIVLGLLSKKPDDRPRNAETVLAELRALEKDLPESGPASLLLERVSDPDARPSAAGPQRDTASESMRPPPMPRAGRTAETRERPSAQSAKLRALALGAGGAAAVALAVGIGWLVLAGPEAETPAPPAAASAETEPSPLQLGVTPALPAEAPAELAPGLPTAGTVEIPGGEHQLEYEAALRALSAELSTRGLRPRDVRSHPRGARAWNAQTLAARIRDFSEARRQLDTVREVAESMQPREWMVYRLQSVERRLGDPPPRDRAALARALWGTVDSSADTPAAVRRFMQRVDALEAEVQ